MPGKRTTKRVLCVGAAGIDYIFYAPAIHNLDAKILAGEFLRVTGGMAANAAIAVSRLDGHASFLGRVGDDAEGETCSRDLSRHGVDVDALRTLSGYRTSVSSIIIHDGDKRLVVAYHDTNYPEDADTYPTSHLRNFDIVLVDVRWPRLAEHVLRAAGQLQIPTVLDGDIAPPEDLEKLARLADYPIFSAHGLRALTGEVDTKQALHKASQISPTRFAGVTLGAGGFAWTTSGESMEAALPPKMDIRDTLAAGDVFHGAFALATAEGMTSSEAAQFATTAATLKCTMLGGSTGAPFRSDVEALLRNVN